MSIIKLFFIAMIVFLSPITSANLSCAGKVAYLGMDQAGQVILANGSGINTICSITPVGNYQINPQACRMFYGALLANQLAGRSVTIYYNDPGLTSCSQIGQWSTQPSAYFIELTN
ncbi:hypothetical protein [Iodobacter fluviatilis]|uniref:Uncharacterized protein n=1 Tax=Iodobacter fluviatilis TaxID=537 RepID=A0A7G3G6E4_9NEIS|nr:hypothetical protein [Iodobacter fluviatilis]QBC42774.1 hypothetical protein C1H71_03895 [Iodobacter fluviatilis]